MGMATLFQGYEKMNVLTAETVAFWNFAKHIRTHAEEKFKLGKYMRVMGF